MIVIFTSLKRINVEIEETRKLINNLAFYVCGFICTIEHLQKRKIKKSAWIYSKCEGCVKKTLKLKNSLIPDA
jgi:hypothetical protein